jgi:threonine dehydratase
LTGGSPNLNLSLPIGRCLGSILGIFRESGANVVEVHHHRFASHAPIGQIAVSVTVETRNQAHIDLLKGVIESRGYPARLR